MSGAEFRTGVSCVALTCALAMSAAACGGGGQPEEPRDQNFANALFPRATLITVGTPQGRCPASPAFTWQTTGQAIVYAGIFTSNIVVSNGRIINSQDNVWAWHSGLARGREGNVSFNDGVSVVGGTLQLDRPATPLVHGQSYVWAVWAWSDDGSRVLASSRETFFVADTTAKTCS